MSMASVFDTARENVARDLPAAIHQTRAMMRDDGVARRFMWVLMAANVALILLPVVLEGVEKLGLIPDTPRPMVHPGTDGSLPEMLNYLQAGLTSLFLVLIWLRSRAMVFLAWAAMFAFILLDDSLEYHELIGAWLVGALNLPAIGGLRAVDGGEILAWAMAGAVLIPLAVVAVVRSAGLERGFGLMFLMIFAGLVFFGVVVDVVHVLVPYRAVMLIEDGGEVLMVALACAVAFAWSRNYRPG